MKFVYSEKHDKIKKREITQPTQTPTISTQINVNMSMEQLRLINPITLSAEERVLYGKILELKLLTLKTEAQVVAPTTKMANAAITDPFDGVQ